MRFVIDIIVLVLVLISTVIGAKKGFVRIFLSVAAFLAAVYLSFAISPVIADFFQTKLISPKLTQTVSDGIISGTDSLDELLPSFVVDNSDVIAVEFDNLFKSSRNLSDDVIREKTSVYVENYVNPIMIEMLSSVVAIILFLLLSAILNLIAKIINKVIKISPAKTLNKFGGIVLGCLNGFIFAAAFCLVLSIILNFDNDGFFVFTNEAAEKSYFYGLFNGFLHK